MFLKKNKIIKQLSVKRLRLSVFRSSNHIYCQIIDDKKGTTIVSASSIEKYINKKIKSLNKKTIAFEVGKLLSEKAKKFGIKEVYFDRNKYLYHGRIKYLAQGARKQGLNF